MIIYTDIQHLYSLRTSPLQMLKRRLQIHQSLIRDSYEQCEGTGTIWIAKQNNPADDSMKVDNRGVMLAKMAMSKHFIQKVQSWITRALEVFKKPKRACTDECYNLKKKSGEMS